MGSAVVVAFGKDRGRVEVSGGDARLEDAILEARSDAATVIDDGQGSVAAGLQGRGDEYSSGPGVACVADQFYEGVLHGAYAGGCAPGALLAREAREPRAQIAVRPFLGTAPRIAWAAVVEAFVGVVVNALPRSRGSRG